jgi:hypothetical protein
MVALTYLAQSSTLADQLPPVLRTVYDSLQSNWQSALWGQVAAVVCVIAWSGVHGIWCCGRRSWLHRKWSRLTERSSIPHRRHDDPRQRDLPY